MIGLIRGEVLQGADEFRWIYLASESVQFRDNRVYKHWARFFLEKIKPNSPQGIPVGVRVMDGTMVQISKELEESARRSSASLLYTFRRIMMSLLIPTYVSTAVIIFLGAIRDIAIVVLLYTPKSKVLSILMLEHYIGMSPEKGMVVGLTITTICILVAIVARTLGVTLRPS
jgi:ABC-type Fe3+ transport system permease subunit